MSLFYKINKLSDLEDIPRDSNGNYLFENVLFEDDGNEFLNFDFSNATFIDTDFVNLYMEGFNFENATFENVNIENCIVFRNNFKNATLTNVLFDETNIDYCNFTNATLNNVSIRGGLHGNNIFKGVKLDKNTNYYLLNNNPEIKTEIKKANFIKNFDFDKCKIPSNVPKYQNIPKKLFKKKSSPYLVHFEEYNGIMYPIVIIPKGTVLYSYANAGKHSSNINLSNKELNYYLHLVNKDTNESSIQYEDRKYFYPIPYAAYGVKGLGKKYNMCNIVSTTDDIRLLCLIAPSPLIRSNMYVDHESQELRCPITANPSTDVSFNYAFLYTNTCKGATYDLCLTEELMKDMNLQGSIAIAKQDSISTGPLWRKLMYEKDGKIPKNILKQILYKSCFTSEELKNTDQVGGDGEIEEGEEPEYENNEDDKYENNEEDDDEDEEYVDENVDVFNINRIYGVPEIVICPLKTQYYEHINTEKDALRDMIDAKHYEYMNYKPIDIVPIDQLDYTIKNLRENIVENKQCLLFHFYKPHMNQEYPYIRPITLASDILNLENDIDIDLEKSYSKNKPEHTVFESFIYNIKYNNYVDHIYNFLIENPSENSSENDSEYYYSDSSRERTGGRYIEMIPTSHKMRVTTMKKKSPMKKLLSKRRTLSRKSSSRKLIPKTKDYILTKEKYNNYPAKYPFVLSMVNNIPIVRPNPNWKTSIKIQKHQKK